MRKLRFGIIGCGNISVSHAGSVTASDKAELWAVCDIEREKAEKLSAAYGNPRIFTDYHEMLASPELDAVCICTPSGMHADMVSAAARAGKHILCEKPLDITREKLDQIVRDVRANGVKMQSVFQLRTLPVVQAVKKAVDDGVIGRLVLADAYLKYYRSQEYYNSAGWRGTWEMDGGGALMNQCIHGIDLLTWIAGDVKSLFSYSGTLARNIEVEDTSVSVLKYKNGAYGVLEGTTSVTPHNIDRFELHGELGTIAFSHREILRWEITGENPPPKPEIGTVAVNDEKNTVKVANTSHLVLVDDLCDAINEDREPWLPPELGRRPVEMILSIYESAKSGREVELS